MTDANGGTAASPPGTRPNYPALGLAGVAIIVSAALVAFKLQRQPAFIDYLTMWTGGRTAAAEPKLLYDFGAIDRAQAWLLGAAAHDRPFPYPPGALLVFAPLARAPFWISAFVWSLLGWAAYAGAAWRMAPSRKRLTLILACAVPSVAWAALSGQCAFIVGALAMGALAALDRRPILAGVALGLAMGLKPTVLMLAPVALLAGGHWRALLVLLLTGAAMLAASALIFGIGPWIDWILVAPGYLARINNDPHYMTGIIAPAVLANRLGLHGVPALAWRTLCQIVGVLIAAIGFRRAKGNPPSRLIAVVGGSLVASPYAMNYETVLLAPAAALLVSREGSKMSGLALAAYVALGIAAFPNVGVYAFVVFMVIALVLVASGDRDP